MESELLKMALKEGLFALLFVVLLLWTMRDARKREESFQSFLVKMLPMMQSLSDEVEANGRRMDTACAIMLRVEEKVNDCDIRRKPVPVNK